MRTHILTAKQRKSFEACYKNTDIEALSWCFGLSINQVYNQARTLGIRRRKWLPWTAKEVEILRTLYPNTNINDLGRHLKRSVAGIRYKAHKLKLRQTSWLKRVTDNFEITLQKI